MSRFRLFLLGLLVVLAAGAASAAPASADSCTGGLNLVFCNSPANLTLVAASVLGSGGLALLASRIGGNEVKVHCASSDFSAVLGRLGLYTGLMALLNCKEVLPVNCKLSAAKEAEIHILFHAQQKSVTLALFTGTGPNEGFADLDIIVGGSCAILPGLYSITGKQLVEMPTGAEGRLEQEIGAKKSESFLKLGTEPASFSGRDTLHLGGFDQGSAWLVMTGV
jgi:hypothetical protein